LKIHIFFSAKGTSVFSRAGGFFKVRYEAHFQQQLGPGKPGTGQSREDNQLFAICIQPDYSRRRFFNQGVIAGGYPDVQKVSASRHSYSRLRGYYLLSHVA
jgi:hypothetical protein